MTCKIYLIYTSNQALTHTRIRSSHWTSSGIIRSPTPYRPQQFQRPPRQQNYLRWTLYASQAQCRLQSSCRQPPRWLWRIIWTPSYCPLHPFLKISLGYLLLHSNHQSSTSDTYGNQWWRSPIIHHNFQWMVQWNLRLRGLDISWYSTKKENSYKLRPPS